MFAYTITVDLILLIITHSALIFIINIILRELKRMQRYSDKAKVDLQHLKKQLEHIKEETEANYKE